MLNQLTGECLPLEVEGMNPVVIEENGPESNSIFNMFEGEATIPNGENLAKKLDHQHKINNHDSPEYWDGVLAYLMNLKLPENRKERA
jgi:hypothetical protein